MAEDRPAWARRIYNERQARGWSQADAIRAMRAHSEKELPSASRACPVDLGGSFPLGWPGG